MEINLVGASIVAHGICDDKHFLKMYARTYKIQACKDVLISPLEKKKIADKIECLKYPAVVKFNYRCKDNNLREIVYNKIEAISFIRKMLKRYKKDILIEEIIQGIAVEFILFGKSKQIVLAEKTHFWINTDTKLNDNLSLSQIKTEDEKLVDLNYLSISRIDEQHLIELFQSIHNLEFVRIIGTIHNEVFYLSEIAPDSLSNDNCSCYFVI